MTWLPDSCVIHVASNVSYTRLGAAVVHGLVTYSAFRARSTIKLLYCHSESNPRVTQPDLSTLASNRQQGSASQTDVRLTPDQLYSRNLGLTMLLNIEPNVYDSPMPPETE